MPPRSLIELARCSSVLAPAARCCAIQGGVFPPPREFQVHARRARACGAVSQSALCREQRDDRARVAAAASAAQRLDWRTLPTSPYLRH
jgi:hypothetical protein